ncbi:uncharacterized protein LOC119109868 [Pollicipes pollicipes]|uniref:uncharacterized protein LOC119109868 n=1 Tax=Pollicipes pollicipes TaxID=41117 RepID=UPI00188540BE|nr:uncharacterized protein LOC119109868 [Pollicipes pollicipes]
MRALPLLALVSLALWASATYISPRALAYRRPVRSLIAPSANPRLGFSFVEAQLARRLLRQLIGARYPNPQLGLLQQLVGAQRAPRLAGLLRGPYRRFVEPIYPGLLPYYLYNRGGARLFSRRNVLHPLRRLTAARVQRQFIRFLTRIDPRLLNSGVDNGVFSTVRSDLLKLNKRYRFPVPLLRNLYNTFISVIAGNGRSKFLLGLTPQLRVRHFSTSLGLYLRQLGGGLSSRLRNSPLLIQDFANNVDGRYILHNSGIGLLGYGTRPSSELSRFFLQLEQDHFNAVRSVLSGIFQVQQSISLASLPQLGYSGLLANRYYPGLHAGQTDIVARYILRALSGYGALDKSAGLIQTLPYLPYVRGLPRGVIGAIQGSDLGASLAGLNIPGLAPRLTPGVLRAARSDRFITQTLLAALLHGVRYTTPQQGTLLFRDILASLLLHEKRYSPAQFQSFLADPIRPFVLLNRVILPNTLPAIRRIPQIQLVPLNSILSLQAALSQGLIRLPNGLHLVPGRPVSPTVPVVTQPPFPSVVVARVTLRSAVARRVYTLLSGGIPVLTVELLQPVLQLFVERRVISVQLLRTPDKLYDYIKSVLLPRLKPDVTTAIKISTVPDFVKDSAFTKAVARLAYVLDTLVIHCHGYTKLEGAIITTTVQATLRSYYGVHKVFKATTFLAYAIKYYPQLVFGGLLVRPLQFGSATLSRPVVTATLAGLRPIYGPVTYHGLGTVLGFPGAAPLLRGVDLGNAGALVRALSLGGRRPVLKLSPADLTAVRGILKPLTVFDRTYSVSDLQFLFSYGIRNLRIPRSVYSLRVNQLFRDSLTSFARLRKPLVVNRIYNPAYLNLLTNRFLVDALTTGSLSAGIRLKIPTGRLTLRPRQLSSFAQRTLRPLGLSLLPAYTRQLLSYAFNEVQTLRSVKPALAVDSFARYLSGGPFKSFGFSLSDGEFSGLLASVRKHKWLPRFFFQYPARLQRYFFDNLFGSYAAYSLLHYSSDQFSQPLRHGSVFSSFSSSVVPSFFRGRKFGNLGDLFGVAPDYFNVCQRSFRTLPGLRLGPKSFGGGSGIVHVAGGHTIGYGSFKGGRYLSGGKGFFH